MTIKHTSDELCRQHYLRQMGITPWYPRFDLPGAAAHHVVVEAVAEDLTQPQTQTAPEPAPPPEQKVAAGTSVRDLVQPAPKPVMKQEPASEPVRPTVRPDVIPAATPEAAAMAPNVFAFTWLSLDARLSVLVQQPPGQRGRLPVPLRDMLLRILKALDPAYTQVAAEQVFQFRWPFDELSAAAGEQASREAACGFMQQRLRQCASTTVLALVDDQPHWVPTSAGAQASSAEASGFQHSEILGVDMLHLPSLARMQADPSLKEPAWKTMQQLIERLTQGPQGPQGSPG